VNLKNITNSWPLTSNLQIKILDSLFSPSVPRNSSYTRTNCSHNRPEQLLKQKTISLLDFPQTSIFFPGVLHVFKNGIVVLWSLSPSHHRIKMIYPTSIGLSLKTSKKIFSSIPIVSKVRSNFSCFFLILSFCLRVILVVFKSFIGTDGKSYFEAVM
jgi:hypothetical protein